MVVRDDAPEHSREPAGELGVDGGQLLREAVALGSGGVVGAAALGLILEALDLAQPVAQVSDGGA